MTNKLTQPVKQFFDIKLEALIPTTLTYRVFAETEQEALELIKKKAPNGMKPNLSLKRLIKATVYTAGSSMVKLTKNYK
jgi:hypothetical protein